MSIVGEIVVLDQARMRTMLNDLVAIGADIAGEYWAAEHFMSDRPRKFELSLVALIRGRPNGYAIVSERAAGHAHLHHLMCHADQRGTGLGTRLLAASRERCAAAGLCLYTLKVAKANEGARRFYIRHGFRQSRIDGDYVWLEVPCA